MRDRAFEPAPEVAQQLRAYGALDNPFRLRAYRMIHDTPGVSFNDHPRKHGAASAQAALHHAAHNQAALDEVRYGRSGMAVSSYSLTDLGDRIHENLFGARRPGLKRPSRSVTKVLA